GNWLETPGGYSDYVSQRRQTEKAAGRTTRVVEAPSAPKAPAAKLTYKDQRRLEELTRLMPERQKEIGDLEDAMADSALFTKDPKGYHARANRVGAARAELAAYEEEWLGLEEKREALTRS
ncbi:MAG: ABC transporter ATP-binding protein, partial [Hyphomonadaceae bacterium]